MSDESWHFAGRLVAFVLDRNAERLLGLVLFYIFTSFRSLRPFLPALTLLSPPGLNKTPILPQKFHKIHY